MWVKCAGWVYEEWNRWAGKVGRTGRQESHAGEVGGGGEREGHVEQVGRKGWQERWEG